MSGELTLPCPACNGDGFVLHENRLTETNKTSCKVCGGYGTIPANTGMTPESSAPADPVERRHTRVLRDDTPVFEHRGHDVNTISRREGLGSRGADPELSRINQEVELSRPDFALDDRDDRQAQVAAWVCRSFSPEVQASVPERVERLYEEVCELAQAEDACGGLVHSVATKVVESCLDLLILDRKVDPTTLTLLMHDLKFALEQDRLSTIAHHVYQKPRGVLAQEVGGISTTLLAYCEARGLSADFCERAELERILALPPDHFKAKQAAKVASGMAVDQGQEAPQTRRVEPKLAEGCCSSISPCVHQRSDPSTLCDVCQDAADSVFVAKTLVMTDAEVTDAIRAEGRDPDKVGEEARSALSATIDMFRRMTTAEAKLHQIYSQYILNAGDMTAEQALKAIEYICTRVDK